MSRPADRLDRRPRRLSVDSLRRWLHDWMPAPVAVDARERLRVAAGVWLGVLVTAWLARALGGGGSLGGSAVTWLVAPIGASAVLVFGLPASPMAQPWPVVAGNALSALIGVGCVLLFGASPGVAALAVGLAVTAMFALRCLHPPGGACALLTVMAGVQDPGFALFPVATDSLLLVAAAVLYNHATGRSYPHPRHPATAAPGAAAPPGMPRFTEADLDAVLARHNQLLDVSREDLMSLLGQAELQAYRRRLEDVRCADIMSRDLATAHFGTSLQEAWTLLRRRGIKALPVIDRSRQVVGVVTLADFMKGAELDLHRGWVDRLKGLLKAGTGAADRAEVVGEIMTREVRVVSTERPIAELVPLFAASGHHHIPVIDAERRLVGIITQSDLVRALL